MSHRDPWQQYQYLEKKRPNQIPFPSNLIGFFRQNSFQQNGFEEIFLKGYVSIWFVDSVKNPGVMLDSFGPGGCQVRTMLH